MDLYHNNVLHGQLWQDYKNIDKAVYNINNTINRKILKYKNERYDSSIFNLYNGRLIFVDYIYLDSNERRRFNRFD